MIFLSFTTLLSFGETPDAVKAPEGPEFRHHVIFDTDANNEIDDQHALAYLLFSGDVFAVEGATVNVTSGPGHGISGHIDGQFNTWGDYSVNLFEMYQMGGDPPSRPLFDQAAVAIVKNPDWAESYEHPAPIFIDGQWVERPDNPRTITIWEWFDIYGIIYDFFRTMDNYVIAEKP